MMVKALRLALSPLCYLCSFLSVSSNPLSPQLSLFSNLIGLLTGSQYLRHFPPLTYSLSFPKPLLKFHLLIRRALTILFHIVTYLMALPIPPVSMCYFPIALIIL